jgi:GNAT superfamily N-acetyltransferase
MITCIRTNSTNNDFQKLVAELDAELAIRDGADHSSYAQFNTITAILYAIVAYKNGLAVGCGAIKPYAENCMEAKRMYVVATHRGQGIAGTILQALETWAVTLGSHTCLLETGLKQPEAIALYTKANYNILPNYGQYAGVENSVCCEKKLMGVV